MEETCLGEASLDNLCSTIYFYDRFSGWNFRRADQGHFCRQEHEHHSTDQGHQAAGPSPSHQGHQTLTGRSSNRTSLVVTRFKFFNLIKCEIILFLDLLIFLAQEGSNIERLS